MALRIPAPSVLAWCLLASGLSFGLAWWFENAFPPLYRARTVLLVPYVEPPRARTLRDLLYFRPPLPVRVISGIASSRSVKEEAARRLGIAPEEMDKGVYVLPSFRDNRVVLTVSHPRPEEAQRRVAALTDALRVVYERENLTRLSIEIGSLENRERELEERLDTLTDEILDGFRDASSPTPPDREFLIPLSRYLEAYGEAQLALAKAQSAVAAAQTLAIRAAQEGKNLPSAITPLDKLRRQVEEKREKLEAEGRHFGPRHPQIVRGRIELAVLIKGLAETAESFVRAAQEMTLDELSSLRAAEQLVAWQAAQAKLARDEAVGGLEPQLRLVREFDEAALRYRRTMARLAVARARQESTALQYSVLSPPQAEPEPWNRTPGASYQGAALAAAALCAVILMGGGRKP